MKFPTILAQSGGGDERQFELEITSELTWFDGHFPGFPVLPGVVQLRWAVALSQQHFDLASGPNEVLRLKFKNVIVPPRTVRLALRKVDARSATFEYSEHDQVFSQGKIRFSGIGQ